MLEMRRLQALQAVVETGSVKEAALRLGYTPSAISQHISTLEAETKSVLLEPAGRGVRPTASGRMLAGRAADLFERMAEAEVALAALNAGELGVLRVASFATAGAELVPPALATLHAALPGIDLGLRLAERDEALSMLRGGVVDVAVVEAHDGESLLIDSGLTAYPLLVDPFRIVLPRDHRLARRRAIPLSETAEEPWIDIRCEIGCCREATNQAFQRAGMTPHRRVEADEYWPAQGFVAAGLGLALIPSLALGVQHRGVAVRRLQRGEQPERRVLVVVRTALRDTRPVRTMTVALQAEAKAQQKLAKRT